MTYIPLTSTGIPPARVGVTLPIRVGLVGTGFVAKLRADTLQADGRSLLVAVTGHTPEKTHEFARTYQAEAIGSWRHLVERADIDLVIICNVNREHGAIAGAALQAGKHVIVEYPLSLNPAEAEELLTLATRRQLLLHVEHLELLGGVHNALKESLSTVGEVFYVRYATITPLRPAPRKWTYNKDLFGFPFTAALSRLHRLTDLFGEVATVSCQNRYWDAPEADFYNACLCSAQLRFTSGIVGEAIYGKGETFWKEERKLEVYGDRGTLIFDGDTGVLVRGDETTPLVVGSRRGLFAKDTTMVLDHLTEGTSLYLAPADSVRTVKVADAARRSAETGKTVLIRDRD